MYVDIRVMMYANEMPWRRDNKENKIKVKVSRDFKISTYIVYLFFSDSGKIIWKISLLEFARYDHYLCCYNLLLLLLNITINYSFKFYFILFIVKYLVAY